MKTRNALIGALLLLITTTILSAQDYTKPGVGGPEKKILTQEDLRKWLCSNIWTWEWEKMKPDQLEKMEFRANGDILATRWKGRYEIKGLNEIAIKTSKPFRPGAGTTALMTLDPTYTKWSGHDFNGGRVWGEKKPTVPQ